MTKFNGKSLLCAEQDVKRYNCYRKCEIKVLLMAKIGQRWLHWKRIGVVRGTMLTLTTAAAAKKAWLFSVFVCSVISVLESNDICLINVSLLVSSIRFKGNRSKSEVLYFPGGGVLFCHSSIKLAFFTLLCSFHFSLSYTTFAGF